MRRSKRRTNRGRKPLTHLTKRSKNSKTGKMPVSTSCDSTCPPDCPFNDGEGCYAKAGGPLCMHWAKVSAGERGTDWNTFCSDVACLPAGQLWRHNQAGDLPGRGNRIAPAMLEQLALASAHTMGWTYTHKPTTAANLAAIAAANDVGGLTINLSANGLHEVDRLADTGQPVVTVLPHDFDGQPVRTPKGRLVFQCPATKEGSTVTCLTCGNGRPLCQRLNRNHVPGFPAHGNGKTKASAIAKGERQ